MRHGEWGCQVGPRDGACVRITLTVPYPSHTRLKRLKPRSHTTQCAFCVNDVSKWVSTPFLRQSVVNIVATQSV